MTTEVYVPYQPPDPRWDREEEKDFLRVVLSWWGWWF